MARSGYAKTTIGSNNEHLNNYFFSELQSIMPDSFETAGYVYLAPR